MDFKAKPVRDEFTFSLQGMAAVKSYVFAPAIPSGSLSRAWAARQGLTRGSENRRTRPAAVHQIEAFLARYFVPGCCHAA